MRVDHVGGKTLTDLSDRGALGSKRPGRTDDPNDRYARFLQLGGEWRLCDSALEKHDCSDILSIRFLSDRQRVNDALESAEAGGCEKVKDLQSPASRRRNPFRESPAGMLSRGSAYEDGDDRGIQPPSIRNAPA